MKRWKTKSLWAAGLALGAAATIASAQVGPGGPGGRWGHPGPGGPMGQRGGGLVFPRLDSLTDAQREQMKNIRERHESELRPLIEQAHAVRQALETAITASPLNEALVREKATELGPVETELAVLRARVHAEIFALLTPEQRQQIETARAQMQERLKNRPRGPRAPGGGGL